MTLIQNDRILILAAILVASITADLNAESRFAIPFEALRRAHDLKTFGEEMEKALGQPATNIAEDIAYLADVCSDDKDELIQDKALRELGILAFELSQRTSKPVDAFRPVLAVSEKHIDEALANVGSKWAGTFAWLTAFAGLQPSPRAIPVLCRALGDKDNRMTDLFLIALARLSPRPAEAKRILLERAPKFDRDERIEILAFALDDPDFLAVFAKSLESEDAYEQKRAIKYLVYVGASAKPALEILYRLQQRPALDRQVAAAVKTAIEQIQLGK